jgi:hypothetical protein
MDTKRIRKQMYGEPTPPNIYSDFQWVGQHETELLEKYGECSIIVYKEQVIGTGKTYDEAVEDAERNLPPELDEVIPIHHRLRYRNPFIKVRPKTTKEA